MTIAQLARFCGPSGRRSSGVLLEPSGHLCATLVNPYLSTAATIVLMVTLEELTIIGHGNERLPNSLFKQETRTDHLAVVLPGLSYRCNEPLLWYPSRALVSLGADVLWVEYAYDKRQDWGAADDRERKNWLLEDAVAAMKAAMVDQYERVTIVAKSLGTLALAHLLSTKLVPNEARSVWLTPVLSDTDLRGQLEATRAPSLLVIGSHDLYYDEVFVGQLRRNEAIETLVIEGGDHLLETRQGVVASIDVLKRVMEAVQRFVSA